MNLKYINHSRVGFVLWPRTDALWHLHVASAINGGHVISAGFASLRNGKVQCGGRSESLGIDSLPSDAENLAAQLGLKAE